MEKRTEYDLYERIQARTGGQIYIGVAGPVRTGKSTMIKHFMELLVLPVMKDSPEKERTRDQLPQSASGKTIMTAEPKFIPKDGVELELGNQIQAKVRFIDCVGYMVDGALGQEEDGRERMVHTPWQEEEMPFSQAAEMGTKKVIVDHSTIGIVVTTDGSFGEIPRSSYIPAEERTIQELRSLGKPFLIILNTSRPQTPETVNLIHAMEEKYGKKILALNCEEMTKEDALNILNEALLEFPINQLQFKIPGWMGLLPIHHPLKESVVKSCRNILEQSDTMRDISEMSDIQENTDGIKPVHQMTDLASGIVTFDVRIPEHFYYNILSEFAGIEIPSDAELIQTLREMNCMKETYLRVKNAMDEVRSKGYGIVIPDRNEISLEEPELMKQGSKYGVRMRASAPSIHMIRTEIQTEISPVVGSEQQAEDLISYIRSSENSGENGIWETNIFGKSIGQIVTDGIEAKTGSMSEGSQQKFQHALQKIVNTNSNGLICIIL